MKIILLMTTWVLSATLSFGQNPRGATMHPDSVRFTIVGTVYADKIKKEWQVRTPTICINGGRPFAGDTNGRFTAIVKKDDVLLVRGLGCEPKKIKIRKRIDSLNIRLFVYASSAPQRGFWN